MLSRRAVQNKCFCVFILQEMKFLPLTHIQFCCVCNISQIFSLFLCLSVCLNEARGHYHPAPLMFRPLCLVCIKLVGLGPGATPFHVTIRVLHKHTCSSAYTSVTQVMLKDIQTHVVSVRMVVAFDSGATVFSVHLNKDE